MGVLWHALAGLGVGVVMTALAMPGWALVLSLGVFGWAREAWQHDLTLTVHQWVEAVGWPVGGAVGYALARWIL